MAKPIYLQNRGSEGDANNVIERNSEIEEIKRLLVELQKRKTAAHSLLSSELLAKIDSRISFYENELRHLEIQKSQHARFKTACP